MKGERIKKQTSSGWTSAKALEAGMSSQLLVEFEGLSSAIESDDKIAEAWEYGRFLGDLGRLAKAGATLQEAALRLGLSADELKARLDKDRQASDVWNRSRLDVVLNVKRAAIVSASKGSAAAMRQIEGMFRSAEDGRPMSPQNLADLLGVPLKRVYRWIREGHLSKNPDGTVDLRKAICVYRDWIESQNKIDLQALPAKEIEKLFGITHSALYLWLSMGMPRNPDKTFDLYAVLRWRLDQLQNRQQQKMSAELEKLNAKKKELQIKMLEKRLIPADKVMAWKVWTASQITGWIAANIEKLSFDVAGLTPERAKTVLKDAFAKLCSHAAQRPVNYYELLPEEVAEDFLRLLKKIFSEEKTDESGLART